MLLNITRQHFTKIPFFLGKQISKIPYTFRPGLGAVYKERIKNIDSLHGQPSNIVKNFIFKKVRDISVFSYNNIPFYHDLYKQNGFDPASLSVFTSCTLSPCQHAQQFLTIAKLMARKKRCGI